MLDDLDRELERRGHRFCRYADDCNIYVRTKRAQNRVMASVVRFLEERLRLWVNPEKSAVAYAGDRQFLGYRILSGGRLGVAPRSMKRARERIRAITRRNRGIGLQQMIRELNVFTMGWVTYYRYAACKSLLWRLDSWTRRKLHCLRLKQRKRPQSIVRYLMSLHITESNARRLGTSGKGWWRKAGSPPAQRAMNVAWFESQGFVSLSARYIALHS